MTKILTLKKRKDFLRVAQGFHVATHNMVLQATRSLFNDDNIRVGYTATKKIGNAVIRSKSKRRLRAIVREVLKDYAIVDVDYIFIARLSTASCDFKELKKDTIYALKKINKNFTQINDNNSTIIE
ncbi:MAG: ribonuclease P protein component [Alphaproteobacteria bacterium]|nr:ribonuclease P protein component [Alphaproteobacteria bacterium]